MNIHTFDIAMRLFAQLNPFLGTHFFHSVYLIALEELLHVLEEVFLCTRRVVVSGACPVHVVRWVCSGRNCSCVYTCSEWGIQVWCKKLCERKYMFPLS